MIAETTQNRSEFGIADLSQEIDQNSSLPQQQKLKDLLISWLEEGDQEEQSETLKPTFGGLAEG